MDDGPTVIDDAAERAAVRAQARRIGVKATIGTALLLAIILLVP